MCVANPVPCHIPQVLWWGIDNTLVELFARHDYTVQYEGNPADEFCAVVGGVGHGPDKMLEMIGMYGGRLLITFFPGEWIHMWLCGHEMQRTNLS